MWKKIALVSLCLVVGFVLGCILTMAYDAHKISKVMFMLQEKEVFEMEEAALQAYYNQPNEVAVWALENYINTLNRLKEERSSAEVEDPYFILSPDQSLVFSHARLGQLYKKVGESEKSKYHFEQAISHSKRTRLKGLDKEEDLIKVLNNLDKNRNNDLK